jgi:hypothetical protein
LISPPIFNYYRFLLVVLLLILLLILILLLVIVAPNLLCLGLNVRDAQLSLEQEFPAAAAANGLDLLKKKDIDFGGLS